MFRKKTVLVLGAGASWHYNYPTGEELLEEIISNCELFLKIITDDADSVFDNPLIKEINTLGNQSSINKFLNKIKVQHPLNIDSFLRLNKNEQDFGKFIITYSLLRCEHKDSTGQITGPYKKKSSDQKCNLTNSNEIKNHNWYRFLSHALFSPDIESKDEKIISDIKQSFENLTIINFNYDTSLEYFLYSRIISFESFQTEFLEILKNFANQRIMHVYESLYKFDWQRENTETVDSDQIQHRKPDDYGSLPKEATSHEPTLKAIKSAKALCERIHVIGGEKHNDLRNSPDTERAKNAIREAEKIVFLGYGFDEANNQLIGFDRQNLGFSGPANPLQKEICYTNFQGSKKVSKIFSTVVPEYHHEGRVFQSDRDVYSALAYDFDLL